MINEDDFFEEGLQVNSDNSNTQEVVRVFNEWKDKQEKLEALAIEVEALSSDISKIKSETMPDLLREMGTELWRDPESGLTVELETAVNSKLPKNQEKRNEIFDALRPIGIEEILAEEFNVTFSPNDKRAAVVRELLGLTPQDDVLEEEGEALVWTNYQKELLDKVHEEFGLNDLPAEEKLGAHPSRLASWLKKKIVAGDGETIKAAGIWHGKHAKMTAPKKGK